MGITSLPVGAVILSSSGDFQGVVLDGIHLGAAVFRRTDGAALIDVQDVGLHSQECGKMERERYAHGGPELGIELLDLVAPEGRGGNAAYEAGGHRFALGIRVDA